MDIHRCHRQAYYRREDSNRRSEDVLDLLVTAVHVSEDGEIARTATMSWAWRLNIV